jgi:hypothetical protein
MKIYPFASLAIAGVIALGTAPFVQPSANAQDRVFVCGVSSNGIPTTYANTPRGQVVVVRWVSQYFSGSGYNPMTRCQEVSSRFERHRLAGNLDFITAGYLNGQPAICAGASNPPCTSEKLLFTLKPGSNAAARIQQLFNIRSGASSTPLYENTRRSAGESATVNMNEFLKNAPVEASAQSPQPTTPDQSAPVTPSQSAPARPSGGGMLF